MIEIKSRILNYSPEAIEYFTFCFVCSKRIKEQLVRLILVPISWQLQNIQRISLSALASLFSRHQQYPLLSWYNFHTLFIFWSLWWIPRFQAKSQVLAEKK